MLEQFLAPMLGKALAQLLDLVLGNGIFAFGAPWLITKIEQSHRFPWFDEYASRGLKICAAITAAATAAGIKSALDLGGGTFVISGLTTSGLGLFAAEVIKQLGLQEVAFQWFLKGRK